MKRYLPCLALVASLASVAAPVLVIGVAPALLVGCSTTDPAAITRAAGDARAIVDGVDRSFQALRLLYPAAVSPQAAAQVRALLDAAPGILDQLSGSASDASNASGLRGIESIVHGVLNVAASVLAAVPGAPPEVVLGLEAVSVLLPIIEATANSLDPAPAKVGATPVRFRSSMSVAEARARLHAP